MARRARLDALIDEQSRHAEWAALVGRLRCTRGINAPPAIGLVAEIGQLSAFARPRQRAGFLGLVALESSTGERRRRGAIKGRQVPTHAGC